MPYDYDRTKTAVDLRQQVGNPAAADDALSQAYRALVNFKLGFDAMEEIPRDLMPFYQQAMKAIDEVSKAQKSTYQLRMMMRKFPR